MTKLAAKTLYFRVVVLSFASKRHYISLFHVGLAFPGLVVADWSSHRPGWRVLRVIRARMLLRLLRIIQGPRILKRFVAIWGDLMLIVGYHRSCWPQRAEKYHTPGGSERAAK